MYFVRLMLEGHERYFLCCEGDVTETEFIVSTSKGPRRDFEQRMAAHTHAHAHSHSHAHAHGGLADCC